MTLPPNARAYVFGQPAFRRLLVRSPVVDTEFINVLSDEGVPFFRLMNAANAHAFGDLGMPAWVQLDCCTMPTAMIGYALPRASLDEGLWQVLLGRVGSSFGIAAAHALADYQGLVPISEFCAVPDWEGGAVGISLFTILPRLGLGLRTKALGLRIYGVREQTGITQYSNPAVRTHTALGPLRIVSPQAQVHSRPRDTFVYALRVPDDATLERLITREGPTPPDEPFDLEVPVRGDQTAVEVARLLEEHGPLAVVWPGLARRDGGSWLRLRRVSD